MKTERSANTAIVWFRQDLRLADNPALHHAVAAHNRIIPVFVLDDDTPGAWKTGGASRWWLHHALQALAHELNRRHATLVLRRGKWSEIIPQIAAEAGACAVYAGAMMEPWAVQADNEIGRKLRRDNVSLQLHRSATLYDPDTIKNKAGKPYEVYGAFRRAIMQGVPPAFPLPAPTSLSMADTLPSDKLPDWDLLPSRPNWAIGFREHWQPGEDAARKKLDQFLGDSVDDYPVARDFPGDDGTSRLSPHLQWGEISPAQIWHAADQAKHRDVNAVQSFKNEMIWREFGAYLLHHHPQMPEHPLQEKYAAMPWRRDKTDFHCWTEGYTGIPIVDAGMRQLWRTGWMHNRVRIIVGSFLVKHLLLPWRQGEDWFWDTLVDANLASNAMNWQWVAGTGADPQPFFRIFNPILQAQKFDPNGDYIRRWVPELAKLPIPFLYTPWDAPAHALEKAGVVLGETYPSPIVDLAAGRARALQALKRMNAHNDSSHTHDAGHKPEHAPA